ncbi:MAG TPA: AlkA N-terminal domain-containing protein [Solirubrobacteraceae bacterium]|jgi:AraC family transcriptional regulator of adaptative response / DNA-3-methyladenine glycosylase II
MAFTARLATRPPFDGAALVAHLAARAVPGVEEVVDGRYRRSLRTPGGPAVIELSPAADHVRLNVTPPDADGPTVAAAAPVGPPVAGADLDALVARCRALFDLDADPAAISAVLGGDPLIGPLAAAAPGLRVPGAVDGAELAVRAVLGQQVSLRAAATLAGRLVTALGEPLATAVGGVTHLFPEPAAIAALDPADLAMPRARARTLLGLAGALADGLDLREVGALPGIGPWTAGYIALRALGDRDVFLAGDLGVRKALERLGADSHPRAAAALAERWRPYRAYAMHHLWGVLSGPCASPSTPSRPTSPPGAACARRWPAARPASG